MKYKLHAFLTLASDGHESSASHNDHFYLVESVPNAHLVGDDEMVPWASLDSIEKGKISLSPGNWTNSLVI